MEHKEQISSFLKRVLADYEARVPNDEHDELWHDPSLVVYGADTWVEALEKLVIDMPYETQFSEEERRDLAEEGQELIPLAVELDKVIGHTYPYHDRDKAIELLVGINAVDQEKIDLIYEWFKDRTN